MSDRYDVVIGTVTMTDANTEYELVLPKDACEVAMVLSDATKAWRVSVTRGVVAAGGFPVGAGQPFGFGKGLTRTAILFACGTAAQTMNYSYLSPNYRGT